jgi:hypothetical protein
MLNKKYNRGQLREHLEIKAEQLKKPGAELDRLDG